MSAENPGQGQVDTFRADTEAQLLAAGVGSYAARMRAAKADLARVVPGKDPLDFTGPEWTHVPDDVVNPPKPYTVPEGPLTGHRSIYAQKPAEVAPAGAEQPQDQLTPAA